MKKFALPILAGLLVLLLDIALKWARPSAMDDEKFSYLLAVILACLGIAAARGINHLLFDIIFKNRKGREAPALLRVLLSIIVYSTLFLVIYHVVLKKDLSTIVATSALATLIVGLALQDTLGNFFAGISLHVEQPFLIGDVIRVADKVGRVETVTWRATMIRTNDNSKVIFPNSKIAREPLEVFPLHDLNRRILRFPAPYSIPPQTIIGMIQEAARTMPGIAAEKTPVARIWDFADSSVTYEILYWVKDYLSVTAIDAALKERIWYVFARNDVSIPFQIRHLLMEQMEQRTDSPRAVYDHIIDKIDILDPLTPTEKSAVARSAIRHIYAPGELILRAGDRGESMFAIYRGSVEVRAPSANGNAGQIAVLEPGNFFGEMALFTGEPRTADVSALGEVEIIEITKPIIQQLFAQNETLAVALSKKIAERQLQLSEYSKAAQSGDEDVHTISILRRIRRFFGIS
jgi:small-conductance mechanosensitive channel